MAQSKEQQRKVGRVMHEFKQGELKSSTGSTVENRKQAIAIALNEAGASRNDSAQENARNSRRTADSANVGGRRQPMRRRKRSPNAAH